MLPVSVMAAPFVGGIIGYITNDIAVRMLFRPLSPVYIGKKRLPFTPGLIPKEKERIAKSLGRMVSEEFLTGDTVKAALLSPAVEERISRSFDRFYEHLEKRDESAEVFLTRQVGEENFSYAKMRGEEILSDFLCGKLENLDYEALIGENVLIAIRDQMEASAGLRMMLSLLPDEALKGVGAQVGKILQHYVKEHGEEIVRPLVKKETENLLSRSVAESAYRFEQKVPRMKEMMFSVYRRVVEEKMASIVRGLDIAKVVEEKILSYDNKELEALLLAVMKKELRAIVWLGALLGFVMGIVQGGLFLLG